MKSLIENLKPNQHKTQGLIASPPLNTRKQKALKDCYTSYIDQGKDGLYGSAKLVRSQPRTTSDTYFVIKTRKTSVLSYRRNSTHVSVVGYRTKKDGATRANIAYMNCSFLEIDGSTDGTIKSLEDVLTLIKNNNLPKPSHVIQTSLGHFHIVWTYDNPLPWNERNESYWLSQQKRKIELFQKAGFLVDKGASMNPCQNLRNPSQLNAFNFKRGCQVHIHKSYCKTSLRAIYRALNKTSIPNPKRLPASVRLRRFLRANQTFEITLAELAETLGTCTKTAQREVRRAVQNGDLRIVARTGNNKRIRRTTEYTSTLYLEPEFSERTHSINTNNSLKETDLLADFQANGALRGYRNKAIFVLAVGLSCKSSQTLSVSEIADQLRGGSLRSGLSEKELVRTIKNAIKPVYSNPFSLPKMREWGLLEETKHSH